MGPTHGDDVEDEGAKTSSRRVFRLDDFDGEMFQGQEWSNFLPVDRWDVVVIYPCFEAFQQFDVSSNIAYSSTREVKSL